MVFKEHFHVIESKAVWAELLLLQSKIAPFAMGTAWGPENYPPAAFHSQGTQGVVWLPNSIYCSFKNV